MPARDNPYAQPESAPSPRSSLPKGLRTAALPARLFALIIDYLLSMAALYGGAWVAYLLGVRGVGILVPAVFVLAKPICEACGGRTPGKAMLGIRVVDPHRRPIGPAAAITRNLGWVLGPGIGSLLAWVMLVGGIPGGVGGLLLGTLALFGGLTWFVGCLVACGPTRRAWHDRFAGTLVLQGWTPAAIITTRRNRRRA